MSGSGASGIARHTLGLIGTFMRNAHNAGQPLARSRERSLRYRRTVAALRAAREAYSNGPKHTEAPPNGRQEPMTAKQPIREPALRARAPFRTPRRWCDAHYRRWRRYGDPLGRKVRAVCAIEGCGKVASARSLCKAHYRRWQRHGDPLGGRPSRSSPTISQEVLTFEITVRLRH